MRMNERLYLTEDRSSVVKEDDRKGRHLLCKKGAELDDKVAAQYGLVDGSLSPNESAPPVMEIVTPEVKRKSGKVSSGSKIKSAELTVHRDKKSRAKGIK